MGREIIDGISILKPAWLIPFKAKAWLDLNEKTNLGKHVDSRDLKKHRNDILRILSELVLEPCKLPPNVKTDMTIFYDKLSLTDAELKNLKITGIHEADIKSVLKNIYELP